MEGDWWVSAAEDNETQVKGVELMTRPEGTEEKGEDMAKLKTRHKFKT